MSEVLTAIIALAAGYFLGTLWEKQLNGERKYVSTIHLNRLGEALRKQAKQMALNQADFDTALAGFVAAVNTYTTVDLSAEAATIATAETALAAEAAKLNPPAPGP